MNFHFVLLWVAGDFHLYCQQNQTDKKEKTK